MSPARAGLLAPGLAQLGRTTALGCVALLLPGLLSGCSKGAAPAESAEAAPPTQVENPAPGETPAPAPPQRLTLPALASGVPAPAVSCPAGAPLPEAVACPTALADLARALGDPSLAGDAALAELEACSEFPRGVVRALRAERLPACADQLVEPVLAGAPAEGEGGVETDGRPTPRIDAVLIEDLYALGLAGRLSRLVAAPPSAPPKSSKAELEEYLKTQLFPWASAQATAIAELSRAGAKMRGYARGVVAVEAALADLRFVEMARGLPLPKEMQAPEVQAEYYAALDEALEPRKDRARDAALVGLGELSTLGILRSSRLAQARQLIARVFAGNRLVALDVLLLPPAPGCAGATPQEVVASSVESPYASWLLAGVPATPALTACLLTRGLPLDVARRLESESTQASRSALARAHFEVGRTYMKADAFQRAAALYANGAKGGAEPATSDDLLLGALAQILVAVPASAADLFRIGPRLPSALGETARLDELASSGRPSAGAAAFDAAYLRELTAPDGSVSHFQDVAKRYEQARNRLSGKERLLAADRARAAQATARVLEKQLKTE